MLSAALRRHFIGRLPNAHYQAIWTVGCHAVPRAAHHTVIAGEAQIRGDRVSSVRTARHRDQPRSCGDRTISIDAPPCRTDSPRSVRLAGPSQSPDNAIIATSPLIRRSVLQTLDVVLVAASHHVAGLVRTPPDRCGRHRGSSASKGSEGQAVFPRPSPPCLTRINWECHRIRCSRSPLPSTACLACRHAAHARRPCRNGYIVDTWSLKRQKGLRLWNATL